MIVVVHEYDNAVKSADLWHFFPVYYYSSSWGPGIPSPLQIFLGSLLGISVCRGTVSTEPFAEFIQSA